MRVLLVHPSSLMYAEVYLRLEPLGLELVADAVRAAGHEARILDLQIFRHEDYFRELAQFRPHAVGFSLNYLANVPEVLDLAAATKCRARDCFVFAGGHSASFIAEEILEHAAGSIDCVLRGEGESTAPKLLETFPTGAIEQVPGAVTPRGQGAPPRLLERLDRYCAARDLTRKRRKYFIGELDPCASIEFTRGCPWDCAFCSAWTFYGRRYRKRPAESIAEELSRIEEPNVFIVDDVAFIHPEDAFAIGAAIERRRIRKQYYLETRSDVLVRNREAFAYWKRLGLAYMFLGLEALTDEELRWHRKRLTWTENLEALEIARSLGIIVAVNVIADPSWDEQRFQAVREWALEVPEIVHLTVNTPYPGTETWYTEARQLTTRDYRLFDVQHAVLPTRLPLKRFYEELVKTQEVLNRKHMGFAALRDTFGLACRLLLKGQTNFVRMLWKFHRVYNADRQYADHSRPVKYSLRLDDRWLAPPGPAGLYVHPPEPRPHPQVRPA